MEMLIAEAGLVGFIFGLIRKWVRVENIDLNELNRFQLFLYDAITCDFCTIFWISLVVCGAFLHPFHCITIVGLWTLVNLR